MTLLCLRFFALLSSGLLAGAVALVWLGDRPFAMSPSLYVEFQQARIAALTLPMSALGGATIILALCLAFAVKGRPPSLRLTVFAIILLIGAMAITVGFNMPINNQVVTWSPEAPPANWSELRDRWWAWHQARTLFSVAAFASLLLSVLSPAASGPGTAPSC
jgi:uncharacterized membrane protein